MAINIPYGGSGGDFAPIVKFDARAGRMFRVDRADGANTPVDITRNFKAVFDFANLEVGWILFAAGGAPDFRMTPYGQPMADRPSKDHKSGVRLQIKLAKECGGDVRELAGTSAAMLRGIDALHDAYLAGEKTNAGKLPVVTLVDTMPIESGSGATKSTNYSPRFEIVSWVARPADLAPRAAAAPVTNGHAAPAGPPRTGSTPVSAPLKQGAGGLEISDDDFG